MNQEMNDIFKSGIRYDASEFQKEIFNEIKSGSSNIVINASAGSAKTTTIVNSLRYINQNKKVLFLAFNRSTVDNLKKSIRIDMPQVKNVDVFTFHGLGSRICRENGLKIKDTIDDYKYTRYVKENIDTLSDYGEHKSLGIGYTVYIKNIIDLINYSRYYLKTNLKGIESVSKKYGIVPIRDEFKIARKVLLWGKENTDIIDHTDLIWLPNELNFESKFYKYDFIFIDEAQDTTLAHQSLVKKCFGRSCRFIAVGDKRQQINVWCGATEEALNKYEATENTKILSLPISYRCPKAIVDFVHDFAPDMRCPENAKNGLIRSDVSAYDAKTGDLVLCRVMSKLIEQYLSYIKNNKKAHIIGIESTMEIFLSLIDASDSKRIDINCATKEGLFTKLYTLYFNRIEQLMMSLNITEEDASTKEEILDLYDNITSIKAIAEGLETVEELKDKIRSIFGDRSTEGITLSTVHRAKGMEAENVFILCPSIIKSPLATKEWEVESEKNIEYVAYTRCKSTLNFVKEGNSSFFIRKKMGIKDRNDGLKAVIDYKSIIPEKKEEIRIKNIDDMVESIKEKPKESKKAGNKIFSLIK